MIQCAIFGISLIISLHLEYFQDVNECLVFGICSHGCVNTDGSFKCVCAPHFKLANDNRTCKVASSTEAYLVYAASNSISVLSLRSKHLWRVAENLNQVIGVCYDGNYVYWTDISTQIESIMKAKTDGSELQVDYKYRIRTILFGNSFVCRSSHRNVNFHLLPVDPIHVGPGEARRHCR